MYPAAPGPSTARRRRWRWYRSRLGTAAVVSAIGGMTMALAVLTSTPRWYERLQPALGDARLTRTTEIRPLPPQLGRNDRELVDARQSVVAGAGGAALLDEQLAQYNDAVEAERRLEELLRGGSRSAERGDHGFLIVDVGCPASCRAARLARTGKVVVLLASRPVRGAPLAATAERRLEELAAGYASLSPPDREAAGRESGAMAAALAAASLCLFFSPFVLWYAWIAGRAPRTPHRHGRPPAAPRTGVADVCAAADESRRRGHLFFALRVGIFVAAGTFVSANPIFAFVAVPLGWLAAQPFTRRSRARQLVHSGAQPQPAVLRSLRLRVEALALRAAAVAASIFAWIVGCVAAAVVAPVLVPIVVEDLRGEGRYGWDVVLPLAVDLAAVFFLVLCFLTGAATLNRLGRRLRRVASHRRQERLPRPPLLYLRAFADDHRLVAVGAVGSRPANELFSFRSRVPYEEVIARALDRHGSVTAIAEPGSPRLFLPLGASRTRLDGRAWRDEVRVRLRAAAVIVIAIGSTEGLLWELEAAVHEQRLDRVLLLVPPDEDEALRTRWRASVDAIRAAGGPALDPAVDPAEILIARISAAGLSTVAIADRRDEHSYTAALDRLLTPGG